MIIIGGWVAVEGTVQSLRMGRDRWFGVAALVLLAIEVVLFIGLTILPTPFAAVR